MGEITYERPREKLHSRGEGYLTNSELIQVIFGSGTATISAAKLAKKVEGYLVRGRRTYEMLVAIKGIGQARACQILASIELGKRMATAESMGAPLHINEASLHSDARDHPSRTLCVWMSGSGGEIDRKYYDEVKGEARHVLARRIFADVVAVDARSMCIVVSRGKRALIPSTGDLVFLRAIKEASALFQVHIVLVHAVNVHSVKDWMGEV